MKTKVEKHFDAIAIKYDRYTSKRQIHYSTLKKLLRGLIPSHSLVFEVGCGTGDLLDFINPSKGYGVDISSAMIEIASQKYAMRKSIYFSTKWPSKKFDYIFMSDVIEHLENPKSVFQNIWKLMDHQTKFINTMMNPLWEPIEQLYTWLGLKMPEGPHNRIAYKDVKKLYEKVGLKIIKHDYKLLIPIQIPFVTKFANRYLEKYFKSLCFIEYFVAVKA